MDFAELTEPHLIEDPGLRERATYKSTNLHTRHFLIRENGKELAFLSLDFSPPPDPLFIYDMFVSGNLRGQGIGTRLLKEIEMLAKRSGYDSIELNAHPLDEMPQEKLVVWYEKRGFSQQDGSKELMMKKL